MVVLEEPYVSETLLNYLEKTQMPILKNDFSVKQFSSHEKLNLIEGKEFLYQYHSMSSPLYILFQNMHWMEFVMH